MGKPQTRYRPADLAAAHGLSAQTVRNYEESGVLPPAARTDSGHRVYSATHVAALDAYVGLLPGFGHAAAGEIMRAIHRGDPDGAFQVIDGAHAQLLTDRATLHSVELAVRELTPSLDGSGDPASSHGAGISGRERGEASIGVVAHRIGVTPATLRKWERAGILLPRRDRGARVYRAADLRDAELAHLLRRGGYPLAHIATVLEHTRRAGGADALAASLADWRQRLSARARAMLAAAAHLDAYLRLTSAGPR